MKLEGKVAIVTGGGQGIGEGIVRCLAEEGADVAVVDINGDTAKKVADDVKSMGRKSLAVVADLTIDDKVEKAVQEALDFFGNVDILVNNVGIPAAQSPQRRQEPVASSGDEPLPAYMQHDSEVWDVFYRVTLKANVMMTHAITPHFIKQQSGKIVNISSISGRIADPSTMAYASFKAGIISITWSTARALASYNVNVNCICPGLVFTPAWERRATGIYQQARDAIAAGQEIPPYFRRLVDEGIDIEKLTPREFWLRLVVAPNVPLSREQTPEDMGRAVIFFASEDAKNVTGQVLHVDGGQVMR